MSKSRTTLTIDDGVISSCRAKGLNISGIAEGALREILMSFEHETDPSTCTHKWTWPFSVPAGLARECVKCGKLQRVIIKNDKTQDKTI